MGKATPVSFIRESVGQICVVGEWLWSMQTERESGRDTGKALARRAEHE